jgi:hypothetical protein
VASRAESFSSGRETILAALRKGRTLLARQASDPGMRDGILSCPGLRSYLDEIRAAADAFAGSAIPELPFSLYRRFEETGDRAAFEEAYFERRRRLAALALSVWLWSDAGHARALHEAIRAICEERAWALPAHLGGFLTDPRPDSPHGRALDLFACETAFAFAEIRTLLWECLPPEISERMRLETESRVLRPFLSRREPWPWEEMRNNWCAVCAGSIGAAALYLVEDEGRLADVLARALPSLGRFMESFPEDGACLEGLGYWTYGVGFFLSFSELLRQATDDGIDLSANEKFSRIAAFQSKAYLGNSLTVSFADGEGNERFRIGLTAWISRAFPDAGRPPSRSAASFSDDRHGRWCLCLRDLIWGRAPEPSLEAMEEPRAMSWLPESQWLLYPAREKASISFAAKGGNNGEPHNHDDVGSFLLAVGSVQVLADFGRGEYTKDYFGEGRYRIFCVSSFGHSLPIIEGKGQLEGEARAARDVSFSSGEKGLSLSMDISRAYGDPSLHGLTRRFEFDGGRILRLRDEYYFESAPSSVLERFVTGIAADSIDIGDAMGTCILSFDGGRLETRFSSQGAEAIPGISRHSHRTPRGRDVEIACLDYSISPKAPRFTAEFEFILRMEAE